ncbi:frequency clock protein [Hirsutella rhossiliensis]|uniref:Frequency clock protein n=1 Tax=Hirsutella rhossiliensis TaxID=111463 RepID=A0A9P8N0G0_9HYPO|nr:frequency clock protein [Hirsutella rhossiliensis]KAH0965413.1 frequency clock protein [Hirsutella rhossiliensis]
MLLQNTVVKRGILQLRRQSYTPAAGSRLDSSVKHADVAVNDTTDSTQTQTHELIMSMPDHSSRGTHPPPPPSATGHPLPRRASAANSVTLRHHRLARDASLRASPGSGPANSSNVMSSPRRNSSGESHETGHSDPKKWFDQSNQNPTAIFDNTIMDVDPPFFQKESDSSNEEKPFPYQHHAVPPRLATAQSSSADDYRSVIDDLTVEIQKLKEELKRYKQKGPDMLRKDKLFEIKIHGLPKRKRRELETTLRDFTASLQHSQDASSSQRNKSRHAMRDNTYSGSGSGSVSKHASSSTGSNARPVDSAYASMSTGANSSGTSLGRPPMSSRVRSSEQKVENYLRDIPEGLYPRHMAMTERDKKRLVVKRLEQLFTGKIGVVPEDQPPSRQQVHLPPTLATAEPSREARILPLERPSDPSGKKTQSRDNGSASNSNGDQTESGGNGNSSDSGANTSPPNMLLPPEQRPTRVKDLDPDRVQVPSENMEYIRHLGLVPPELLADASRAAPDVHPDAEGWVYLNLLCSLAQLHMINVTPSFVRFAVSEMSTKFQLSPDGRKIRWRGGSEGTRFSGDSSGDASQRSPDTDDTTCSNNEESCKRRKTGNSTGDGFHSGDSSSKKPYTFGPQVSGSSEGFHYKPLFVQQGSPDGQTSIDDTVSSFGPVEDSNMGASRWELSGSGTSNRRKRRHDGAIIYYSGAPFCTDLSGDCGDVSPATYMLSSGQEPNESPSQFMRPLPRRSESGSSLCYRPLNDHPISSVSSKMDVHNVHATPGLTSGSEDEAGDVELDLSWSGEQQYMEVRPLEPCGLGGVLPDDHFMVVVSTKRPIKDVVLSTEKGNDDMATDCIVNRLATMSTSYPVPRTLCSSTQCPANPIEVQYVSGRIKRLAPVPLPPPAIFFPPFSNDDSSDGDTDAGFDGDDDEYETSECTSRKANPHQSDGYPDGVDLSSGDEDGEDPDDEPETCRMYDVEDRKWDERGLDDLARRSIGSAEAAPGTLRGRSKSAASEMVARTGGSSVATAGGVESGYSSSVEASS